MQKKSQSKNLKYRLRKRNVSSRTILQDFKQQGQHVMNPSHSFMIMKRNPAKDNALTAYQDVSPIDKLSN